MPEHRKLSKKESNPPPETEVNKFSSLVQKFVPKTSELKGSKAMKREEQEEIASRLLLCDSIKKTQKCKEEKLPPPPKPTKLNRMPPPKSPPHQLPSTAVTNHSKIQKQGGKSPTNQSEERTNFSGPKSILIGRRQ